MLIVLERTLMLAKAASASSSASSKVHLSLEKLWSGCPGGPTINPNRKFPTSDFFLFTEFRFVFLVQDGNLPVFSCMFVVRQIPTVNTRS